MEVLLALTISLCARDHSVLLTASNVTSQELTTRSRDLGLSHGHDDVRDWSRDGGDGHVTNASIGMRGLVTGCYRVMDEYVSVFHPLQVRDNLLPEYLGMSTCFGSYKLFVEHVSVFHSLHVIVLSPTYLPEYLGMSTCLGSYMLFADHMSACFIPCT